MIVLLIMNRIKETHNVLEVVSSNYLNSKLKELDEKLQAFLMKEIMVYDLKGLNSEQESKSEDDIIFKIQNFYTNRNLLIQKF